MFGSRIFLHPTLREEGKLSSLAQRKLQVIVVLVVVVVVGLITMYKGKGYGEGRVWRRKRHGNRNRLRERIGQDWSQCSSHAHSPPLPCHHAHQSHLSSSRDDGLCPLRSSIRLCFRGNQHLAQLPHQQPQLYQLLGLPGILLYDSLEKVFC